MQEIIKALNNLMAQIVSLQEIMSEIYKGGVTVYHQRELIKLLRGAYGLRGELKVAVKQAGTELTKSQDEIEDQLITSGMAKTVAERDARKQKREEKGEIENMEIKVEAILKQLDMFKFDIRTNELEMQKTDVITATGSENMDLVVDSIHNQQQDDS